MPLFFEAAATNAQLNKLRGIGVSVPRSYAAEQYVSLRPNTTIFKARINGATSGNYWSLTYDTVTIGAIADVRPQFRVIVSPTDNRRDPAAVTLRTRDETHTSSILYVSENSEEIGDNWYLFVIKDPQLTDKLARPLSVTEQRKDFDDPFERLAPVVDGLDAVYIGYVDPNTGVMTVDFDVTASYPTDAISWTDPLTFLWEFESGTFTITVGTDTDDTITVEFNEGHQIGQLTITDSNGVSWIRYFDIFAHGDTFTPVMGFDGAQWSGELQNGFTANIVAFDGVDDVLDETFAVIWRPREYYNGTEGELVAGRNIDFVGWINREDNSGESDAQHSFLSEVSFEFVGVGARLALLEGQILALRNSLTPDEWDEIEQFYASWRGKIHFWQRHTTLLHLFPLAFDLKMKNTSYVFPLGSTQGGNALAAASGLAQAVNGSIEFAPDGRIQVVRDLRHCTATDHTDAVKVATFDNRDLFTIKESRNHFKRYGQVVADGAYYNASTGTATAVRAIAPGHARGSGAESGSLSGQILTETAYRAEAELELRQRAGNCLLILNDEGNELTAEMPDGYFPLLIPSVGGYTYAFSLDGSENVRGIVYDNTTLWLLKSVSLAHNNEIGARTCTATFIKLIGPASLGDTIEEITPGEVELAIPDLSGLPAFDDLELPEVLWPDTGLDPNQIKPEWSNPPKDHVAKIDGSTLLGWATDQLVLLEDVIMRKTPRMRDITPPGLGDFENQCVIFDPRNKAVTGENNYAYDLVSDGTDSKVERTANVFNPSPTWIAGASVGSLYTLLRGTSVDGGLMIYAQTNDASAGTTVNLTYSTGGAGPSSVEVGDEFTVTSTPTGGAPHEYCEMHMDQCCTLELVSISNWTAQPGFLQWGIGGCNGSASFQDGGQPQSPPGFCDTYGMNSNSHCTMVFKITSIAGGDSVVRYSSDRGNTWGSEISVGDSPGALGGFDVQRSGTNSYAACNGKVRRATTLGGAYSDYYAVTGGANAVCIVVPYFNWAGAKQTSAAHPDIVIALNQADGSGRTLLWIEGGATPGTVHDITPTGIIFSNANCVTVLRHDKIACFGTVSGTAKLAVSEDQGSSYTLTTRISPVFIRDRRNDARDDAHSGQLYLADNTNKIEYSSKWGYAGVEPRNVGINVLGFDPIN